ncbi:Os03g0220300, partial [Oryza sativa Japonica Group]
RGPRTAQPGGGCFRCPQVSAEADDLGIRQIKLLRNQRCAHNFGIASPMRVGRHGGFLQLPHPSPLHVPPDLSLPSLWRGNSHGRSCLDVKNYLVDLEKKKSQFMCMLFVFRLLHFF